MSRADGEDVKRLLHEALDQPEDARAAYVAQVCGTDLALATRVRALLAALRHADALVGDGVVPRAPPDLRLRAGDVLAGYRIESVLGEGGFGTVYLAEQQEPVRRRVALKVVKPGMDSGQVLARFEAERHTLALMDHPHIARVLDAGTTPEGLPFFVMELVDGVPITRYCSRRRSGMRIALELFRAVCLAVQHAHNKGVIHRDIKPSNVLVAEVDGRPLPKVIDFGIAKVTLEARDDATLFTREGQPIGTPAYMSPEQAGGERDVDTRSDVYSLGVLLYELVAGAPPFDQERLGWFDLQRAIREVDPPRPSSRPSAAEHTPRDLDWVVMRCLEKDRARRYPTAAALAADVERVLGEQPVEAAPPGMLYRARKLARRHRVATVAALLALLSLAGGAAAAGFALRTARREAREAQLQAHVAREVNAFLNRDLFSAVAPSDAPGKGRDVLMRDVLDAAARRIEDAATPRGRFADLPLVEGAIRHTLGSTYLGLGLYDEAESHLSRAHMLRAAHLGAEHAETLRTQSLRADRAKASGDYAAALQLHGATLAAQQRALGPRHVDTLASLRGIAAAEHALGRNEAATQTTEAALAVAAAALGATHRDTLRLQGSLATLHAEALRYDEAEELLVRTLATQQDALGVDDTDTLVSLTNLAVFQQSRGRIAQSAPLLQEALARMTRVYGADHPTTLTAAFNLGILHLDQRSDLAAADALLGDLYARSRDVLGERHPETLRRMSTLGRLRAAQGRVDEAEDLLGRAHAELAADLGSDHPHALAAARARGALLFEQGRLDEVEALLREIMVTEQRALGPRHPSTIRSHARLCTVLQMRGRLDEAEAGLRTALAHGVEVLGADHPLALGIACDLGELLMQQERFAEAERALVECHEACRARLGQQDPLTQRCVHQLVALFRRTGREADAATWAARARAPESDGNSAGG